MSDDFKAGIVGMSQDDACKTPLGSTGDGLVFYIAFNTKDRLALSLELSGVDVGCSVPRDVSRS